MKRVIRYGFACLGLVAAGIVMAWLTLESEERRGVLAAAAVAVPVQILAFAALARARPGSNAFLAAWMGGTMTRFVVVGVAGWVLVVRAGLPIVPTMVSLAGFFFAMLLLEPLFLRTE